MGFNFRKSFKIAPGVKLNVSKKGISSVSLGGKSARVNLGKKGTRTTVGIPKTGLSYAQHARSKPKTKSSVHWIWIGIIVFFILIWIF